MIKGDTVKMRAEDMPFYHRQGAENGNTYVSFGKVKMGGNEPYCYTEEKQCAGHIRQTGRGGIWKDFKSL